MIIWRGFGWLVPIIFLSVFMLSQIISNVAFGHGYYTANTWPKALATIFVTVSIGILGYILNHKKRVVMLNKETGAEERSPSHTLFFIPIEYWAIILPVFAVWAEIDLQKNDAQDIAYLQSPKVNDKYIVDFSRIYNGNNYTYGLFKVTSINNDVVELKGSRQSFSTQSLLHKEIRQGITNNAGYFLEDRLVYRIDELIEMKNKDTLFSVLR